jgi:hypothetical protein
MAICGLHIRLHSSRSNNIDRSFLASKISWKAAPKCFNCCFASGVNRITRNSAQVCRDRRHQNQPAAMRDVLISLLRDENLAARIQAEHAICKIEFFRCNLRYCQSPLYQRWKRQCPKCSMAFSKGCDLLDVGAIGLESDSLTARSLDLFDVFRCWSTADAEYTTTTEAPRACACHQCYLVLK